MAQTRSPLSSLLALRRGSGAEVDSTPATAPAARPKGPLIWAHCAEPARLGAVADLVGRLRAEGDRLNMVLTVPPPGPGDEALAGSVSFAPGAGGMPRIDGVTVVPVPADQARLVRRFLDDWRPDVLLWIGGPLRSVLLGEARRRDGMARILAGLDETAPLLDGRTWLPGLARSTLDSFDAALVSDVASGARLRKAGLPEDRITVAGPFEPGSPVLPYREQDHRELMGNLGPRPAWHAADVPEAELAAVIDAHRVASRRSHRLLLILSTAHPDAAEPLLRTKGLSFVNRANGEDPAESTEVLLTDTAEPGLWFRMAALSYLGGTLTGGDCRDPFEPALLGSGLLHGLRIERHRDRFDRLTAAGASRYVSQPGDLGGAIETLLAPDKAAAMAHAAWEVTSAGAETSNRIVALILAALDRAGEH